MTAGRVPVTGFNTGSNKWDESAGVESLAVEMRNGLWLMPSGKDGLAIPAEGAAFSNQTLRMNARVSIGGSRLRVRLSNAHGNRKLMNTGGDLYWERKHKVNAKANALL